MQKFFLTVCYSISIFLSSCAIYKIDVQQGNVVTQEMLDQLELHMPAQRVKFIMGTPLIIDVFHQNRWDYLYSLQTGNGKHIQRHISLLFDENEHLMRIEGDVKVNLKNKRKNITTPDDNQTPLL